MALLDQVGLKGPEYKVFIERGKIREFARAMEAHIPEFMEFPNPVIPATFLVSAPYTWGYTLERPRRTVFAEIEHDLSVSLHAEESFKFSGNPLLAGDQLIATPELEKVWQKNGNSGGTLTFLTILNTYRDLDGKLRAEQRSTSVTTEASPGDDRWQPELPDYDPDYPQLERASTFSAIKRQKISDLKIGEGPKPIATPPLLKQEIVRFQGVVGEDDPLHHDPEWAIKNGYPGVFALGTHQASMMAAYASYWLDPHAVRSYKVRFREVVWPGDQLSFAATITDLNSETGTASIHLTCMRQKECLVSEAWAEYDFSHC